MPTYNIYAPSALVFSGGTVSLSPTFAISSDVRVLDITDDDGTFEGDLTRNEDGNDVNQFGTLTDLNGGAIAGGANSTVYSEQQFVLTGSDGSTIRMWQAEIDSNPNSTLGGGFLAGYIIDAPLQPGISYSVSASNTVPTNDPAYTDLGSVPICFTPGSLIRTPRGLRPVETLQVGDLVLTQDNGPRAIRWVGRRDLTAPELAAQPNLQPVRIRAHAFGPFMPERDILVSPQHRFLIEGAQPQLLFDAQAVLAPAKGLINTRSILVDPSVAGTSYIHLLFDQHEIIWADSVPTESFHPGHVGIEGMGEQQRREMFEIFPELAALPESYGQTARPALRVQEARLLAA